MNEEIIFKQRENPLNSLLFISPQILSTHSLHGNRQHNDSLTWHRSILAVVVK